jgi:hypothetical protein
MVNSAAFGKPGRTAMCWPLMIGVAVGGMAILVAGLALLLTVANPCK